MTIYVGGAAATFAVLALILAIPDMNAVISGQHADPVGTLLSSSFGDVGAKLVLAVILVSFFSNTMSLEAPVSRMLFSYARDGMLLGSRVMQRVSAATDVPIVPLIVSGVIPGLLLLTTLFSTDALVKIVSFGAAAIYVAFGMVVLGALAARTRGWVPAGPWTMGRWGMPVTIGALTWGGLGPLNLVRHRRPEPVPPRGLRPSRGHGHACGGVEDSLHIDRRNLAQSNAEMVKVATEPAERVGRPVAAPDELRGRLTPWR